MSHLYLQNLQRTATFTLVIATLLAASAAQAVTLNKTFTSEAYLDTFLGGTTVAVRPELAGIVIEDDIQAFSFAGVFGTVQNRVVREDGTGTLDFSWRINVDPASTGNVSAFRLADFDYDQITDADWRIDGLPVAPDPFAVPVTGRVFNPASYPDGAINFLFPDPPIGPGAGSKFFFLHTTATNYLKTASYDLLCAPSGCISDSYLTFAPAAVPGPATFGLMSLGLGALGIARKRHRRA